MLYIRLHSINRASCEYWFAFPDERGRYSVDRQLRCEVSDANIASEAHIVHTPFGNVHIFRGHITYTDPYTGRPLLVSESSMDEWYAYFPTEFAPLKKTKSINRNLPDWF